MKLLEVKNKFESEKLFLDKMIDKVVKLGEENPDFVYTYVSSANCSYNGPAEDDDGEICGPEINGCIFGQALKSMGWSDQDELETGTDIVSLLFNDDRTLLSHPCRSTDSFKRKLRKTQRDQDTGNRWGDCVISLREHMNNERK